MRLALLPVALGAVLAAALPAAARAQSCTVTASAMAFGDYRPFSALPTDSTGSVTVRCQAAVSLLVGYQISLGTGGATSYAARRLSQGGNTLQYQLYTDLLRTTVWGNGTGGTSAVTDGYLLQVLVPVERTYTVYGRLPARQNAVPGSYADALVVTLAY